MLIKSIRGMNDMLPQDTDQWHHVESVLRGLSHAYGYQEIRTPILEESALFKRSVGDATDIVCKEMYEFTDRNGSQLCLRPEGTAAIIRSGLQHGLIYHQIQRLWYMGPMFRHERPQKGRFRQFHQWGLEVTGLWGPDIDVELLLMTQRLWAMLGLASCVRLEINSLGSLDTKKAHKAALVDYFTQNQASLDEDSRHRLHTNPLRILDSKNPAMHGLIAQSPKVLDYFDQASEQHFNELKALLDESGVPYVVNPHLVRGLDYYDFTVFEWVTDRLGAQSTVCAGGRYHTLVAQLGGKPTPAVGLALGLERLMLLLDKDLSPSPGLDVYVIDAQASVLNRQFHTTERLRNACPELTMVSHCGGGNLKKQMRCADKSGAAYALILDGSTHAVLKPLRSREPQQTLPIPELIEHLKSLKNRVS